MSRRLTIPRGALKGARYRGSKTHMVGKHVRPSFFVIVSPPAVKSSAGNWPFGSSISEFKEFLRMQTVPSTSLRNTTKFLDEEGEREAAHPRRTLTIRRAKMSTGQTPYDLAGPSSFKLQGLTFATRSCLREVKMSLGSGWIYFCRA